MPLNRFVAALALAGSLAAPAFAAAPLPIYVQFSGAAKGALYRPDPALFPAPHVGVIVMHRDSNYLNHISTKELPKRGFVVLGMNPRCDNNEAACAPWENNALDVKQGVNYLKTQVPGITKIVLLGHSGGGPTMAFYEAVAEDGVGICQTSNKLMKCDSTLAGLPKADGVILMDAHPGNGINAVRSISANVLDDIVALNVFTVPPLTTPTLDPFNPRNGWQPGTATKYSDSFKTKYFRAQSTRMNYFIKVALERLAQLAPGEDAPFIAPLADNARLSQIDLSIHHSTLMPRKLLKNDGTIESRFPVVSVRPVSLSPGDEQGFGTTMFLTLKSFLSVRAIRSNDSFNDVDFCSSNNSTPCNLQQLTAPLLVTTMGGHYFIRDAEQYFDLAVSPDKDFYVIEGATHGGTECTACETTPGQYSNATKNLFDLMASWMNARF
ncbi:MAG TPA: hypothetical protein VH040_15740 [Usitatibacter sp.]|jgi:hypothetical protein|nr:hypothetical protein [Usitatibacter sp.]